LRSAQRERTAGTLEGGVVAAEPEAFGDFSAGLSAFAERRVVFRVLERQLRGDLGEVPLEREAHAEAELLVGLRGLSAERRGMRLPAEGRVGFARTDRLRELPLHRCGITLDERQEVRQAAGRGAHA